MCEEPSDLTNDQARMIKWYESIAPLSPIIPCPPEAVFESRINYSNNSGVGIDRIPYAFFRIHPALFPEILAWGSTENATATSANLPPSF